MLLHGARSPLEVLLEGAPSLKLKRKLKGLPLVTRQAQDCVNTNRPPRQALRSMPIT